MSSPELSRCARELRSGLEWRAALERFLLALEPALASEWMQVLREGRAAWLPLGSAPGGARALLVGNACSGTGVSLARAGFRLVVVDSDRDRIALARARDRAVGSGTVRFVHATGARLPFGPQSFDLVVRESLAPPLGEPLELEDGELARVAADELVTIEENRFAYKRSSGRHGDFQVVAPHEFALRALAPRHGGRTHRGHLTRRVRLGFSRARAMALYPHAHDFTYVASLDRRGPGLMVGPKERTNRLKIAGQRLGLFPWLAPSFAVFGARHSRRSWAERLLDELGRELGAGPLELEHLVASRGNCSILLTRSPQSAERGALCIHAPHSAHAERQCRRHLVFLGWIRERWPCVPVPEPLGGRRFEGRWIGLERRLDGRTAAQQEAPGPERSRTHRDVAEALAGALAGSERLRFGERELERFIAPRVARVVPRLGDDRTARAASELARRGGELLLGTELPCGLHHADLRAKHVVANAAGELLGLLDWGSAERADLPYFDLLNLVLHDRKQERGGTIGEAWAALLEGRLERRELDPLERYVELARLEGRARRAIELLYPLLVGAMAEGNWDYSRPRWIASGFDLERGLDPAG